MPQAITQDYISGAAARARKEQFRWVSDEWTRGYNDASERLSPIETDILMLTMRYQTVSQSFIRELEESFREPKTC